MRQAIRGYVDGLIDRASLAGAGAGAGAGTGSWTGATASSGGGDVARLATEVASISSLLDSSNDLRSALNDPGIPLTSRRAIVSDLLSSRVDATTLALVNFVIDADRAPETSANLQWAAGRLQASTRGQAPTGEVVLGRKGAEERIDGYASALLESVQGDRALGDLEDELFRFSRIVNGSDQLRQALTSRDMPADARRQLVRDLLQQKASPAATALASYATQVGRARDFEELLEAVVTRVAAETNRRLADVRSATEMDQGQRDRLAAALTRALGHDVEVRVRVDKELLAGFVATVGDTVVDASARHRLDILRERLVLPEANITTGDNR